MMYLSLFLNIIGSLLTVVFLTGHYLGMSPYVYMMLTSVITEVLYDACHRLPGMVLFAKLIPENVESSMFAMLTGLMNFSNNFLNAELAIAINHWFFGIYYTKTDNNLQESWKLYFVQAGMCFLPMCFIWLIPKRDAVKLVQIRIAEDTKTALDTRNEILEKDDAMDPETFIETVRESVVLRAQQAIMRNSEAKNLNKNKFELKED